MPNASCIKVLKEANKTTTTTRYNNIILIKIAIKKKSYIHPVC